MDNIAISKIDLIKLIRGLLPEYGLVASKGIAEAFLETQNGTPNLMFKFACYLSYFTRGMVEWDSDSCKVKWCVPVELDSNDIALLAKEPCTAFSPNNS